MNNIGEQVNQVLNNLAEKFGVTVDRLYPILRKQAQVEMVKSIIILIICIAIIFVTIKFIKKHRKDIFDDEGILIITLVLIGISFFACAIGISEIMDIIQIAINPDYYIAKILMDMIKNVK